MEGLKRNWNSYRMRIQEVSHELSKFQTILCILSPMYTASKTWTFFHMPVTHNFKTFCKEINHACIKSVEHQGTRVRFSVNQTVWYFDSSQTTIFTPYEFKLRFKPFILVRKPFLEWFLIKTTHILHSNVLRIILVVN